MSAGGSNARQAAIAIRQVEKSTGASRVALAQAKLLNDLGFEVSLLVERGNADVELDIPGAEDNGEAEGGGGGAHACQLKQEPNA